MPNYREVTPPAGQPREVGNLTKGVAWNPTNDNGSIVEAMDALIPAPPPSLSSAVPPGKPTTAWRIESIQLDGGDVVEGIYFQYRNKATGQGVGYQLGGGGGDKHDEYSLEVGEYVGRITGRYRDVIAHIEIHIYNTASDDPVHTLTMGFHGESIDRNFTFDSASNYEIIGYFGREGSYIDAIGFFERPISN